MVQGSERRRRLHLPSACPPGPCSTQELESFTRSHGSDFLLVIRLSVCTSSSSSLPHGSLLLLLLHLSFSFHFLSIRLLRRFIAMMTAAEQHLQNSLFKSEHLTCYSTNASHKQMLCCRSDEATKVQQHDETDEARKLEKLSCLKTTEAAERKKTTEAANIQAADLHLPSFTRSTTSTQQHHRTERTQVSIAAGREGGRDREGGK